MHDLRAQAQETFHRTPDNNPFSGDYNQPPEKKGNLPELVIYTVTTILLNIM